MPHTLQKENTHREFLPAAGRDVFLPLYDILTRAIGADRARRALLEQAEIRPGQKLLDIGCGTGTLAVLLKQLYPAAEVVGVDPDPKALERAERKAKKARATVRFDHGFGDSLEYADRSFDHVFSSFMFHHVDSQEKPKMLAEVRRVLKPGGSLHLLDFTPPAPGSGNFLTRAIRSHLQDNDEDKVLFVMRAAGLVVPEVARRKGFFGLAQYAYYHAMTPAD